MKTWLKNTVFKMESTDGNDTGANGEANTGYSEPKTTTTELPLPEVDDYGYTKSQEGDETVPPVKDEEVKPDEEETPSEKPSEEPSEEDKKLTGYTEEEESEEPAKEEESEEEVVDFTDSLKELPEGYDAKEIEQFAKDNKMSKEQVEAYVKLTQGKEKAFAEAREAQIKETRAGWMKELKEDASFGGENFDKNVHRATQVLNLMPNTKKVLTERGGMLPPSTMRDLVELYHLINPSNSFEQGGPTNEQKEFGVNDFYK